MSKRKYYVHKEKMDSGTCHQVYGPVGIMCECTNSGVASKIARALNSYEFRTNAVMPRNCAECPVNHQCLTREKHSDPCYGNLWSYYILGTN